MDAVTKRALAVLRVKKSRLTKQQYKTLKGQVLAGNADAAMQGLQKILERSRSII